MSLIRGQQEQEGAGQAPATGANREPLGRKEQGNEAGAAGVRSRREEQDLQLRQGDKNKRKRPGRRSQSSGSGEEEEEGRRGREKGRKEDAPNKSLPDYPGVSLFTVRREEGGEEQGPQELGGLGGRSRLAAPRGLKKTTAPPFRSSSSSLLLPRVSAPVAGLTPASPGSQ